MPIDLLDTITRSIDLTNAAGAPVDADLTPTYAITLPDGTAGTAPSVQHPGTGQYYTNYVSVQSGLHAELWTAVVGGVQVVIRRSFTVEDTVPLFVDTDEAIGHLRASGVIVAPADLEQLRFLCGIACSAVQSDLGRKIARQTVVQTFDGGRPQVALTATPLISVTTAVESGVTLAAGDYTPDTSAHIVHRGGQQSRQCWAWGRQNITLTTVVGWLIPPREIRKVALNGVQRMWAGSQQMPHPSMDDFGAERQVAAGVLTPLELAAYETFRAPGMA